MTDSEKYMSRCLQLALKGKGFVNPNPMVGAVVVHKGKIIGEGFHRKYGEAHAEVNAINSVKDKSLLNESIIYVSLEPCSHHGKTPPCAQLIIDSSIPHVVVACLDPYSAVSGRGMEMLQSAGIAVEIGILEKEAKELNKDFFVSQTKNRPYIYLKWAQTRDGFIDKDRNNGDKPIPTPISNNFSKMLVHKKRAEVSAIMIGTNTALNDNPSLTTRLWYGKNPVRIVIDRQRKIPLDYTIFDGKAKTIVFTDSETYDLPIRNVTFIQVEFDKLSFENIFRKLKDLHLNSILIEGGQKLLQSLIDNNIWDEAFIETSGIYFGSGLKAPSISANLVSKQFWQDSEHLHLKLSPQP